MGLAKVMRPGSVAVVGASKSETKRGYQSIRTLLDGKYEGRIYPINPKEDYILGLRCYKSVSDIEDPIDMALICTPAATIPKLLQECGEKGIGGAVILAGGFRETGQSGRKLEEEMVEVARRHNIRIIGPNTSGMLNLIDSLN
ncbi:MAG: CoA-binding protein, partial [Desulfatitalea sp.]|nr:CoA-binding protein [Desulfatitalea sp.]